MRVPPGAESGSLVQFEPPPLHEWRGTSLDADPAISSIELPTANSEDPPEPSEQSEVRLDVNEEEDNQENKHESFAHAMMSTHGRDFFDESVIILDARSSVCHLACAIVISFPTTA